MQTTKKDNVTVVEVVLMKYARPNAAAWDDKLIYVCNLYFGMQFFESVETYNNGLQ